MATIRANTDSLVARSGFKVRPWMGYTAAISHQTKSLFTPQLAIKATRSHKISKFAMDSDPAIRRKHAAGPYRKCSIA